MEARSIFEKWRLENKMTQTEMASVLGLNTQQNYNDIVTGRKKNIDLEVAAKFLEASGINLLTTNLRNPINLAPQDPLPESALQRLLAGQAELKELVLRIESKIDRRLSEEAGSSLDELKRDLRHKGKAAGKGR